MTFSSPSWRSFNPLKGSLNHPKKVTKNRQVKGTIFVGVKKLSSNLANQLWQIDTDFVGPAFMEPDQLQLDIPCKLCYF